MPRSGGSSSGGSRSYGGTGSSRSYGESSSYKSPGNYGGSGYGGSGYSGSNTRHQSTIYTPPQPQPPPPPPPVNPVSKINPKADTKPESTASTTSTASTAPTAPTITQSASSGFGFGFGQIWGLNMGHLIFGRPIHTHREPEIKKETDDFDPKYLDCAKIEDMYLSTSNPDKQLRTAYAKCKSAEHSLHGV